ncbi:MucR family transcriptional regulator [Bosea sp. RAF48]|uniref:MucR family transcriptional regulator n=1 Tax=Bosea sp. RAF48 TaxID=3237480 RepID=UPI003F8FEF80
MPDSNTELLSLSAMVVAAYVQHNSLPQSDLAGLIQQTHTALTGLGKASEPILEEVKLVPAVPIKKSITPDWLICLEDGKKFKSLRRHLTSKFGLTPAQYRAKWGLPSDYPMVAPNYSEARAKLAKSLGLGRKAAAPLPPAKPTRGGRKTPTAK